MWWWWVREYFGHTVDERLCDFFGFWSSEESQKSLALLLLHAAAIFFVCLIWSDVPTRIDVIDDVDSRRPSSDASHSALVLLLYAKKTKDNFHVVGWFILVSGSLCRCYITWHCSFSNIRVRFFNFSILDSPYTAHNSSPQTQSSQDALTLMHLFCFIFLITAEEVQCLRHT